MYHLYKKVIYIRIRYNIYKLYIILYYMKIRLYKKVGVGQQTFTIADFMILVQ